MNRMRLRPAAVAALLSGLALGRLAAAQEERVHQQRPNFLFLIGEGQGWSTLSVPMDDRVPRSKSESFQTPNLDHIARSGMRFANFYAPSPRCTPSRAAFFTGKSPARLHMTFVRLGRDEEGGTPKTKLIPVNATTDLPQSELTIAELLKQRGYATAHFGKWHLGRANPAVHGYDENDGPTSNDGPDRVENPNPKQAYAIARRGIDFMERAVRAGKPFYVQIAEYAGRDEHDVKPETYAAVEKRLASRDANRVAVAAVAEDADITYGMLLKKLDQLGVANNTYVIYTSDHGSPGRNPPLRGGKGTVWEGGLRVPLLIMGPRIKPGSLARQRAIGVDLFPTIAELAGIKNSSAKDIDGRSLVPLLQGGGDGSVNGPHKEFVVHFPHYDKDPGGPASAIYLDNYKLIRFYETDERRLFDLARDAGERNDLASQMSRKVAELDQQLTAYLKSVDAQMPRLNPNADPEQNASTRPGDRRSGTRKGGNGRRRSKPLPNSQPNP